EWRAGPALEFVGGHCFGVAAREIIFGFGEGGDVEFAVDAGLMGEELRLVQRNQNRFVLWSTRRENASDSVRRRSLRNRACRQRNRIPDVDVIFLGKSSTNDTFLCVLREPAAFDFPPRISFCNSGLKFSAIRERNRMISPRSNQRHIV